jgi:hypothetical protein
LVNAIEEISPIANDAANALQQGSFLQVREKSGEL